MNKRMYLTTGDGKKIALTQNYARQMFRTFRLMRADLRTALRNKRHSVLLRCSACPPEKNCKQTYGMSQRADGTLRIGCCIFDKKNADKFKRWAGLAPRKVR